MEKRYWLRTETSPWEEATEEQFVQAERSAGFYPKLGCGPVATGGFSKGDSEGKVTYGDITKERYGGDPEFLDAATAVI